MVRITSCRRRLGSLAAILASAALSHAQSFTYYIQAGAYDSAQEAAASQVQLLANCSPVTVQIKDGNKPYKVCVGAFSTYMDAHSHRQKLKKGFLADAFITSSTGTAADNNVLPVDAPFLDIALGDNGTSAGEYWDVGGFGNDPEPDADLLEAPVSILNRDELLLTGLSVPKHPWKGVHPLEEFLNRYSDDPKANHARLRLARVYGRGSNPARAEVLLNKVLRDGNPPAHAMARFIAAHVKLNKQAKGEAYEAFRALANDGLLPSEIRRQAMWRAAAVAHSRQDFAESWLAYKHIAKNAESVRSAHEAHMQMAGLMFEMVSRGKATWDETRALCRLVADDATASHEQRATAKLMYLETFFEQKQYAMALAQTNEFLAAYGNVPREAYVAQVWKGLCLYKLNRQTESKPVLEQVALADIAPSDKFANSEPSARAAVWLAHIADKEGNPVERSRWVELLKKQYPDGPEMRALASILGTN